MSKALICTETFVHLKKMLDPDNVVLILLMKFAIFFKCSVLLFAFSYYCSSIFVDLYKSASSLPDFSISPNHSSSFSCIFLHQESGTILDSVFLHLHRCLKYLLHLEELLSNGINRWGLFGNARLHLALD